MEEFETSKVYTEEELLDLIQVSMEDFVDDAYDREVSAICTAMQYGDSLKYCTNEYIDKLISSVEMQTIKQWIANMAGHLASNGVVGFVNILNSTVEHSGTLLSGLISSQRNKMISEKYIEERFDKIAQYQIEAKEKDKLPVKEAVEFSKQEARFAGLISICDAIVGMAESSDEDSFADDKVWDTLAQQSNGVAKAEEPKRGSNFRQFRWIPPFEKSFDFVSSEWNNPSEVEKLKKMIYTIKTKAFTELITAAKYLKKICGDMQSEVEHTRFDNYEKVSREYARTYVVSKLISSVQALILKELNTFCSVGIKKLGKFDIKEESKEPETEKE